MRLSRAYCQLDYPHYQLPCEKKRGFPGLESNSRRCILQREISRMSLAAQEERALARWRPPGNTLFNRFLTLIVVGLSRFIMRSMNSLTIEGETQFAALLS